MRQLLICVILLASAGCGFRSDKAVTVFSLTSSAFHNAQRIPAQYTCDGSGEAPPLQWSEPPQGTRSLALVVDDPDAPGGTFDHWGVFDIPASTRSLAASAPSGKQAINGFGKPGYGGPCPPPGHGAHHYRFKLYALDVDSLSLPVNAKVRDVEKAARAHLIGRAELTGTYHRK